MTLAAFPVPGGLDRVAVVGGARDWTWRELHAAAAELAPRLPANGPVCNLCSTRVGFLVTWLAALRRDCLLWMPPSGGHADLLSLLDAEPGTTVVVDDETQLRHVAGAQVRGLVCLPQVPRPLPADDELALHVDWDRKSVCLYTSGSTGAPTRQPKTLRQLVAGAQALAERLDALLEGGLAACEVIVCSVPHQHMFGFETSVLLPMVTGLPVLDRRPLLPMDVRAALAQAGHSAAWIATPLHLRAHALAGVTVPHCRLALVSTMPLAPSLAAQVEPLVQAPVIEIFGSTETGVIATRRTARETRWHPIGDVRLAQTDGGTEASGAHFASPHLLADLVELAADGSFELLGRAADLVKVGGRRASLSGLNLLLQDLPGLQDGAFHLPAGDAATNRLVLFHAGALDRPVAEAWLRARIDPAFLPRTWVQVDRLPRDGNGKLPAAALAALHAAHRATRAGGGDDAALDFAFRIPADHPSLAGHFPGRPIVPGVLILDRILVQLAAQTGRAVQRVTKAKFVAPLLPDEDAHVVFKPGPAAVSFRVRATRTDGERLIAEGAVVLET